MVGDKHYYMWNIFSDLVAEIREVGLDSVLESLAVNNAGISGLESYT